MPMGYSFNLDAFSIYITLAAVFIAQADVELVADGAEARIDDHEFGLRAGAGTEELRCLRGVLQVLGGLEVARAGEGVGAGVGDAQALRATNPATETATEANVMRERWKKRFIIW